MAADLGLVLVAVAALFGLLVLLEDMDLLVLGRVDSLSWTFAVWALGAVERELRRGGSAGAMPPV